MQASAAVSRVFTSDELAEEALKIQNYVVHHLSNLRDTDWISLFGMSFTHSDAERLVRSPHGWQADNPLADMMTMFVADAITEQTGVHLAFDIFDDDKRVVRTVGTHAQSVNVNIGTLILRGGHYWGTTCTSSDSATLRAVHKHTLIYIILYALQVMISFESLRDSLTFLNLSL